MENQKIDGKFAHSTWQVLSVIPSYFTQTLSHLLRFKFHTGRQHQIRRHLFWQGHPMLGDDLYCFERPLRSKGLFLFATKLWFIHPITETKVEISLDTPEKKLENAFNLNKEFFENRSKYC